MTHRLRLAAGAACALLLATGASSAVAKTASSVSPFDENYLQTSIQGDRFEIIGGRLALRRSSNKAVRQLARTIVKDHSKSLSEAISTAHKLGISVPTTPTPPQVWELQISAQLRGRTFNRWWSYLEVLDHRQDIKEATDETKKGHNTEIKQEASKEIPTLRHHLALAVAALAASGGRPAG